MMLEPGTIVETDDGRRGAIVNDSCGVCDEDVVPVALDGCADEITCFPLATLKFRGKLEPVADTDRCGLTREEGCCIFLVGESLKHLRCGRFGKLHDILIEGQLKGERHPRYLYPKCQLPPST